MLATANEVDQSGASAEGHIVGRDLHNNIHISARRSQIEGWLERLAEELRDDPKVRGFVDNLQYYMQPYTHDGVVGLVAKLEHAGRSSQKRTALRRKEEFSKLLAEWQAYPAAQEIIAYFLSKIESSFESKIVPLLGKADNDAIDCTIIECLVDPVLAEMGAGPFMLNYNNVSGMVYWLAEQCYIRWHK
jgi:hypothetical protein